MDTDKELIDNVFYYPNSASLDEVEQPIYRVCNYVAQNADDAYQLHQAYEKTTKVKFTPELTAFCKVSSTKAKIFDKKLVSDMEDFISSE